MLGKLWFLDLNHMSRIEEDDVVLDVFNDDKDGELIYNRSHLILLQFKIITGCSSNSFAAEIKKWDGSSSISYNGKSRKKITFAGLDLQTPVHSAAIINPKNATFKGPAFLKFDKPDPNMKLYPVVMYNRTFIG